MQRALLRHNEPMEHAELLFLQKKRGYETKQYYKVYSGLMFMSFIIPFAGSWYRAYDGAPNAFSMSRFFASAGTLLLISSIGTWGSYAVHVRKLKWDLRTRTKTVEISHITRKQYMPQTDTYFFYIDSPNKLSIEVSSADYHRMEEGDEVSIEYTTHAGVYLGYF